MTLEIRRDSEIYAADGGWFHARWHFSFDKYHDPEQMGVGPLRVFNDDRLEPGAVWPMHPHRDIESCTYVAEGHFAHDDSLGNDGRLDAGAAQVMRFSHAGAMHSELNGSETKPMRFIQFWFLPSIQGLESSVQQRQYRAQDRTDALLQIMGPEGEEGLDLAQDARVFVSRLTSVASVEHEFSDPRCGYLYVMDGVIDVGGDKLSAGDAAKIFGPEGLHIAAVDDSEVILIDVVREFQPVGVWA
ncbi:MAG TPA: pirin family protein [Egibacteraceae bacterium]|nr:pirin family protein [Egibacteraceae bacterium]